MLTATKTNVCFFIHAVFGKADEYGVSVTADSATAIVSAALDAAECEEQLCMKEGVEVLENAEAMYQQGQDWGRDNLVP